MVFPFVFLIYLLILFLKFGRKNRIEYSKYTRYSMAACHDTIRITGSSQIGAGRYPVLLLLLCLLCTYEYAYRTPDIEAKDTISGWAQ